MSLFMIFVAPERNHFSDHRSENPKKQTNIKLNPNTILYMLSFTFVTRYIYSTIKDLDFEDVAVCISMVTEVMTGKLQTATFLK